MSNLPRIFASVAFAASLLLCAYKPESLPIALTVVPLSFRVICEDSKPKQSHSKRLRYTNLPTKELEQQD